MTTGVKQSVVIVGMIGHLGAASPATLVEPATDLLRQVWQLWRQHFWQLPSSVPRIWST